MDRAASTSSRLFCDVLPRAPHWRWGPAGGRGWAVLPLRTGSGQPVGAGAHGGGAAAAACAPWRLHFLDGSDRRGAVEGGAALRSGPGCGGPARGAGWADVDVTGLQASCSGSVSRENPSWPCCGLLGAWQSHPSCFFLFRCGRCVRPGPCWHTLARIPPGVGRLGCDTGSVTAPNVWRRLRLRRLMRRARAGRACVLLLSVPGVVLAVVVVVTAT